MAKFLSVLLLLSSLSISVALGGDARFEEAKSNMMELGQMLQKLRQHRLRDPRLKKNLKIYQKVKRKMQSSRKVTVKQIRWIDKSMNWAEASVGKLDKAGRQVASEKSAKGPTLEQRKAKLAQVMQAQVRWAKEHAKFAGKANLGKHLNNLKPLFQKLKASRSIAQNQKIFAQFSKYRENFRKFVNMRKDKMAKAGSQKPAPQKASLQERKAKLHGVIQTQVKWAREHARIAGASNYKKHMGNLTQLIQKLKKSRSIAENQKIFAEFSKYRQRFRSFVESRKNKVGQAGKPDSQPAPSVEKIRPKFITMVNKQLQFARQNAKLVGRNNYLKHAKNLALVKKEAVAAKSIADLTKSRDKFRTFQQRFNQFVESRKSGGQKAQAQKPQTNDPQRQLMAKKVQMYNMLKTQMDFANRVKAKVGAGAYNKHMGNLVALRKSVAGAQNEAQVVKYEAQFKSYQRAFNSFANRKVASERRQRPTAQK